MTVKRLFTFVLLSLIVGCSSGSDDGISLKPTQNEMPIQSCAESLQPKSTEQQQGSLADTQASPCRNLSDINNQLGVDAVAYDLSGPAPRTVNGRSRAKAVILTGAADRFWKAECSDVNCYISAAYDIQTSYVAFIDTAKLQSKTIIFADNTTPTNKKNAETSPQVLSSAEAVLRAMFRRLELSYDQSRFVPMIPGRSATKSKN